jgi:hypothetical protein
MEAVLKFNLNDEDDVTAHKRCVQSLDMALMLWDIDGHLRKLTKHAPDTMSQETYDELTKLREWFYQNLNEKNISLDNLLQ